MLVLRVIIAIGIVGICGAIGIKKSKRYETREYILREAIMLFRGIESEIKYTLTALPNAIESARQGFKTYLKDVLGTISLELIKTNNSKECITNEIARLGELTPYDKQIIASGIISLGNSDIDGQLGIINLTCHNLENQLNDSIESKKKNSKMYKTLGLAMGLIIAIIFI